MSRPRAGTTAPQVCTISSAVARAAQVRQVRQDSVARADGLRAVLRSQSRKEIVPSQARPFGTRQNGQARSRPLGYVFRDRSGSVATEIGEGSVVGGSYQPAPRVCTREHAVALAAPEYGQGQSKYGSVEDSNETRKQHSHKLSKEEAQFLEDMDPYVGATIINEFGDEELISSLLKRWKRDLAERGGWVRRSRGKRR